MRHIRLPAPVLRVTAPVLRLWWKVRRPSTFGVKVLLRHPTDPSYFLVVRHSYSDPTRWGLPGGGYRPERETPERAAAREVAEELAIMADPSAFDVIETVESTLEGKRDTLTILRAVASSADFELSPELAEARWINAIESLGDAPVSRWLTMAIDQER